jgi:hypothetical protein
MARREPWVWNEIEHWILPEVRDTMTLCVTQEEADDFTQSFAEVTDDVEQQLGYIIGTISDEEERTRLFDLFGVEEVLSPQQLFKRSSLGVKDLTPDGDAVDS